MADCVFCEIVAGRLPCSPVYEDEALMAFLDIHPIRPGHTLVIPRRHAQHLHALPDVLASELWRVGRALSETLRAALPADDVHLLVNDGAAAWQTVPHVHLHLVPRRAGDTLAFLGSLLRHPLGPLLGPTPRERLDATAARIRAAR